MVTIRTPTISSASVLADPESVQAQALAYFKGIIVQRGAQEAFAPEAAQQVLTSPAGVFAMRRMGERQTILVVASVTGQGQRLSRADLGIAPGSYDDLVAGAKVPVADDIDLGPFQVLWLDVSDSAAFHPPGAN